MEILIENDEVRAEFYRWTKFFGDHDPYTANGNIGLRDVLRAHFLIADYFFQQGYGMGGIGPRDANLLHSAVYRQFAGFAGKEKWETSYERCATLVYGLVKDHPFHDANKRTALLVLLYFLNQTNRMPTVGEKELEDFIVELAEGKLNYRRLRAFELRKDDPEIYFIADYLRRNSRQLDKRNYTITYKELDARLREFDYCLYHPNGNFIDVCRIEQRRGILGLGEPRTVFTKVTQIGFPGWKRQVRTGAISAVRKATKLIPEKGVDSASFYRGTDPLNTLIAVYSAPLERLANR